MCIYHTCFPGGASGKESACQCRRCKRLGFNPWVRKVLWRRKWQPTPVFLTEKLHGQMSLVGSWGRKELDTAEQLSTILYRCMLFFSCKLEMVLININIQET